MRDFDLATLTRAVAVLIASFSLGACITVGDDHQAPNQSAPDAFADELGRGLRADPADLARWWTRFDDDVLDELIGTVIDGNLDLKVAWSRVVEAQALLGVTAGERYPRVDLTASSTRRRISTNNDTPVFPGFPVKQDINDISLGASWEVDLWGRVRRSVEAADAGIDVATEDMRDLQVSLIAQVAARYIDLRESRRRLDIARSNLDIQQATLRLVQVRFDTGIGDALAVSQSAAVAERTRAAIPRLVAQVREAEHALAVLSGRHPDDLASLLATDKPIPVSPAEVAIGVPADLLRRRPDLRRAEREIAAQSARVGVAIADQYPRVHLLGSIGRQSGDLSALFDHGSEIYSLGPSIQWPLFAGGALSSRVDAEEARLEQAKLRYEAAALDAYREAADAVIGFLREHERRASLEAATEQATRSVDKSESLYREGLVDFQRVLDSQRTLFEVEDELAISEATIARRLVDLMRALGGGIDEVAANPS